MRTPIIFSFCLFLLACSGPKKEINSKKKFTLRGKAIGMYNDTLYLSKPSFGERVESIDTIITNEKGEFVSSKPIQEFGIYTIGRFYIPLDTGTNAEIEFDRSEYIYREDTLNNIILKNSKQPGGFVTIRVENKNKLYSSFKSNGLPHNKEVVAFYKKLSNYSIKIDSAFKAAIAKGTVIVNKVSSNTLLNGKLQKELDNAHQYSYIPDEFTEDYFVERYIDTSTQVLGQLIAFYYDNPFTRTGQSNIKHLQHSKNSRTMIANAQKLYPNNRYLHDFRENLISLNKILLQDSMVKNFTLKDDKGNKVEFISVQSKIKLLYFWTSYNVLAEEHFKAFKQTLETHKPQSFELVTVSFDENEADWIAALEKYNLKEHIHLVETTNANKSPIFHAFNLHILPEMVLYYDNKMVIRTHRPSEMEKELIKLIPLSQQLETPKIQN